MNINYNSALETKWASFVDAESHGDKLKGDRREVVLRLLENQEYSGSAKTGVQALFENGSPVNNVSADMGGVNSNNTTNISGIDGVMINMVRRSMHKLIAYDVAGVQAMDRPNTVAFALRAAKIPSGTSPDADLRNNEEAFYNEADSAFSGKGTQSGLSPAVLNDAAPGAYTYGTGLDTLELEQLGVTDGLEWSEMGMTIEKIPVLAKGRGLRASFTQELVEDLQRTHGLSAQGILTELLSNQLIADINREVLRTIYVVAKPGSQNTDLATPGTFDLDVDSNGRWAVEKFKGMLFQIEREANQISVDTRMGKGNIVICSLDVASALSMAGVLDYAPALSTNLQVDDNAGTFAGVLQGRFKVYVDPYAVPNATPQANAGHNFFIVGYRGASQIDAGLFYCPYIPLQMSEARDPVTFQPAIGFKTRYGMVANPFAEGSAKGLGRLVANTNVYYRRSKVINLSGTAI